MMCTRWGIGSWWWSWLGWQGAIGGGWREKFLWWIGFLSE